MWRRQQGASTRARLCLGQGCSHLDTVLRQATLGSFGEDAARAVGATGEAADQLQVVVPVETGKARNGEIMCSGQSGKKKAFAQHQEEDNFKLKTIDE